MSRNRSSRFSRSAIRLRVCESLTKLRRCVTSPPVWRRSINVASAKTVLITGCSSGIGRSCAILFAKQGYNVVATARNLDSIRDLAKSIDSSAGNLRITTCDVSCEQSILAAVQFAQNEFKRIDILVNNAGYGLFGPIELLPVESARRQFEVNTIGPMRLVQLVVPGMREAGWGRIINVSSVAGRISIPMGGWYSASKHAIEALTDALRLELGAFGIHTVSILPGPVETKFIPNIQTTLSDDETVPDAYRKVGEAMRQRKSKRRRGSVTADYIAEIIVVAASAAKPKTRYIPTARDSFGLSMRKLLPDRAWDRLIAFFYEISDAIQPKKGKHTV